MMNEDTFLSRFKTALFRSGMKQLDVAEKAGLSAQNLSNIVRGVVSPDNPHIIAIAAALGVDSVWLATGRDHKNPKMDVPRTTGGPTNWPLKIQVLEPNGFESMNIRQNQDSLKSKGRTLKLSALSARIKLNATAGGSASARPPHLEIVESWKAVHFHNNPGILSLPSGQVALVNLELTAKKGDVVAVMINNEFLIMRIAEYVDDKIFLLSLNSDSQSLVVKIGDLKKPPMVVVGVLWSRANE